MVLLRVTLAVSAVSLVLQAAAARHHAVRYRAASGARRIAVRGCARSAAWHAVLACGYLTVIALQAAGVRLPGHGLSAESLIAFAGTQAAGLLNSALDLRLHHQTAPGEPHAPVTR